MRTQTTRTIAGRVNADGSIANGSGFTVQRTAAGTYTITLTTGTLSAASASAASLAGGVFIASTQNHTGRSFGVVMASMATVATDAAFGFTATVAT
jgi:hypothetical protein